MDTSKEYIAMCDCEEIQGGWKPMDWDVVYIIVDKDWYGENYVWRVLPHSIADSGVYGPYIKSDGKLDKEHDRYIWLPRQDQIQEMLDYTLGMLTTENFYEFCHDRLGLRMSNSNASNFDSMEQLWLAFYMREKHSKKWNGTEWVLTD